MTKLTRQVFFEGLGTFILVLSIVGSGIMASTLTNDRALILFFNAAAIAATLFVIISVLAKICGAYFNPAVILLELFRQRMSLKLGMLLIGAQFAGGFFGTLLANFTFGIQILTLSTNDRFSLQTFTSEVLATAGLLFIISKKKKLLSGVSISLIVALWVFGAILFTSSTSFANPAVTVARVFTDSFTGISPISSLWFLLAEVAAVLLVLTLLRVTKLEKSRP